MYVGLKINNTKTKQLQVHRSNFIMSIIIVNYLFACY